MYLCVLLLALLHEYRGGWGLLLVTVYLCVLVLLVLHEYRGGWELLLVSVYSVPMCVTTYMRIEVDGSYC